MTTLLRIDSSLRGEKSLTRRLTEAFVSEWATHNPGAEIIARDLAASPPPLIDEAWIAAAFTPADQRTRDQRSRLALSDAYLAELERASILVIGAPMYNYGMPAALKSWFDHVIRIGRTFSFDLARGDYPLEPILHGKTLVILSSHGEFGFEPGGLRGHMEHLIGHIRTCSRYLGVESVHSIRIEYQEFGDERHAASAAKAIEDARTLARSLSPLEGARDRSSTEPGVLLAECA